ncbi:MAG: hypothetical protein RBR66_03190 [Candidatus Izemoplasmatales bacterium]|jgi:hypothetical protein|nr:hypothetical protein [Candidatus Izemoplasmatales bacterium]
MIKIIKNDLINFYKYRILYMVIIVSIIFAVATGIFPTIDKLLFIYMSLFILPVITHSILLFIEKEDETLIIKEENNLTLLKLVCSKMASSLILQLIPLVLYLIVIGFVLQADISYILFILVYLLSIFIHILIGQSITILANNHVKMMLMYIGYIIIFSLLPFLALMNVITVNLSYFFMYSPALLTHILLTNITLGTTYFSNLQVILSVILLVLMSIALIIFIIKPFYKKISE